MFNLTMFPDMSTVFFGIGVCKREDISHRPFFERRIYCDTAVVHKMHLHSIEGSSFLTLKM